MPCLIMIKYYCSPWSSIRFLLFDIIKLSFLSQPITPNNIKSLRMFNNRVAVTCIQCCQEHYRYLQTKHFIHTPYYNYMIGNIIMYFVMYLCLWRPNFNEITMSFCSCISVFLNLLKTCGAQIAHTSIFWQKFIIFDYWFDNIWLISCAYFIKYGSLQKELNILGRSCGSP